MTSNCEGAIVGRGIIEKESLRRNRGGEIMEEQSLRSKHGGDNLGSIWELCGKHLGCVWESFGSHVRISWDQFARYLGMIWEAFGGLKPEEASGRHLEVRSQKLQYITTKLQKFHSIVNSTKCF